MLDRYPELYGLGIRNAFVRALRCSEFEVADGYVRSSASASFGLGSLTPSIIPSCAG
jgi:hypothetical protein